MQELRGKVAVITGGASGIGYAVASRAAEAGMRVVLADIDASALERAEKELSDGGAEVAGVVVDVTNAESVTALAARAYERFGSVNLLVNNAGVASVHAAWDGPLEEWSRVLGVNLFGVVHGVRAFVPRMIASGEPGHVVNLASAAGLVSTPGLAAYCASKSGVVALSEALHHDLRARRASIGVSVVCPSWVKTRIARRPVDDAPIDAPTEKIRAAIFHAVEEGIPALDVAATILDAVRDDRFYVITHEPTKAGFAVRAKDILEGRPPTLFSVG